MSRFVLIFHNFGMRVPLFALLILTLTFTVPGCTGKRGGEAPAAGGILVPNTGGDGDESDGGNTVSFGGDTQVQPLVNPGENQNILTVYEHNLDLEQSYEQILITEPLDNGEQPLELMIASINPARNEYDIVWRRSLGTRGLTGITLRADDLTGNGREDIIVTGFDTEGVHVTEVYAAPRDADLTGFTRVFHLGVDGSIDIVGVDRSAGYYSGLSDGEPYRIVVQQFDPESENTMDMVETEWNWAAGDFAFRQGASRLIKAETILEERIERVYRGDAAEYEDFLSGGWFRERGTRDDTPVNEEMLYFDPKTREIRFYDGAIQEVFVWGTSHRATAKRLYTRVENAVIPSISDSVRVSAESWDTIELTRVRTEDWNGSYRRLGDSLARLMSSGKTLPPLIEPLTLSGIWKGHGGEEIAFDLPRVEWTKNGERRVGTASVFSLDKRMVLQVRFMKPNGAHLETANWLADIEEDRDDTRIIRSLSLSSAILEASGIRPLDGEAVRFEQIELLTAG